MNHGVGCPRVPMPRRGAVVGVRLTRCAVRAGLLSNETEEFNLDSSPTVGSSTLFGTGSFHGSRNRKRERESERERERERENRSAISHGGTIVWKPKKSRGDVLESVFRSRRIEHKSRPG